MAIDYAKRVSHFKIAEKTIAEVCRLSVTEAAELFASLPLSKREERIAERILKEIRERSGFLLEVGVGYLTLGGLLKHCLAEKRKGFV